MILLRQLLHMHMNIKKDIRYENKLQLKSFNQEKRMKTNHTMYKLGMLSLSLTNLNLCLIQA